VVVDSRDRYISFINPIYISKAFLQDKFNMEMAERLLTKIRDSFPDLKNSVDRFKFQALFGLNFSFIEGGYCPESYSRKPLVKKVANWAKFLISRKG